MPRVCLLGGLGLLALTACELSPETPVDPGTDYYPLQVGAERIYDVVDSVIVNNSAVTVTPSQVREQLTEQYRDAAGSVSYKLVRSVRRAAPDPWRVDSVQTLTRQAQALLLTRSNRRTVELVFPVRVGTAWDTHAFSQLGAGPTDFPTSRYEAVGEAFSLGSRRYERAAVTFSFSGVEGDVNHTRTVRQVYVKGLGPVQRVYRQLSYCQSNRGCPVGTGYVVAGRIHRETLVP